MLDHFLELPPTVNKPPEEDWIGFHMIQPSLYLGGKIRADRHQGIGGGLGPRGAAQPQSATRAINPGDIGAGRVGLPGKSSAEKTLGLLERNCDTLYLLAVTVEQRRRDLLDPEAVHHPQRIDGELRPVLSLPPALPVD